MKTQHSIWSGGGGGGGGGGASIVSENLSQSQIIHCGFYGCVFLSLVPASNKSVRIPYPFWLSKIFSFSHIMCRDFQFSTTKNIMRIKNLFHC